MCGICHPGIETSKPQLEPMLAALILSDESTSLALCGSSAALGVVPRGKGDQSGEFAHARIAIVSDLVGLQVAAKRLVSEGLIPAQMSVAEQVIWLYLRRGLDFVEDLRGAFAMALWDDKNRRLILVGGRMGLETNYLTQEDGRVLFASCASPVRGGHNRPTDGDY